MNCYECTNLTNKAKTSFICFDLLEEDPCKLHKMPKDPKQIFTKWKCYNIDCSFFKKESNEPIKKCKGCGYNLKTLCFLHTYPAIEWLKIDFKKLKDNKLIHSCPDYNKEAYEVKAVQTKTYQKYNKEFRCRMSYDGEMPLTERMYKGMNCSLCDDRGGTESCPLTNDYLRKKIEKEIKKELSKKSIVIKQYDDDFNYRKAYIKSSKKEKQ